MTTREDSPKRTPARRTATWVVASLFAGSTIIGVIAYARYVQSEKALTADLAVVTEAGKTASVEGCVDLVMDWSTQCAAMKSLCDLSVPRMMFACLNGQDRTAWCGALTKSTDDTSFGFEECKARGAHKDRSTKGTCATVYRTLAAHCKEVKKAQPDPAASAAAKGGAP